MYRTFCCWVIYQGFPSALTSSNQMHVLYFPYQSFNWVVINGVLFWLMLVLRVSIASGGMYYPPTMTVYHSGGKETRCPIADGPAP